MNRVPELISQARRKNQAYQTYYGPEAKITNAITRDLAADKVISRRSWFPTVATAEYFASTPMMKKHYNMEMTKGRDLTNVDSFRERKKPGTLPYHNQWGSISTAVIQEDDMGAHTLVYVMIIVLAIVFISMFF